MKTYQLNELGVIGGRESDSNIYIKNMNGYIQSTKNEQLFTFPVLLQPESTPNYIDGFRLHGITFIDGKSSI